MKALLFMKGESERLPGKNIKEFNGKPLCYWVINTLVQVPEIEEVYIDTDSMEIQSVISDHFYDKRIRLLDRPEHLKGNHITAQPLIAGILDRMPGDTFLQTHVTNPLIKASTIMDAISTYRYMTKNTYDTLIGVTEHRAKFYDAHGQTINHDPLNIERTQDIEPTYEDNNNLYIFSRETFNLWGRAGLQPYLYVMDKAESIDIDTESDWIIAERVMKNA